MKIIHLDSKRKKEESEVNQDAIEVIEAMIPRIKSGEITAIGISWVDKEGSIGGTSSKGDNKISLWASLEHNAREFHRQILEDEI